MPRKKQPPRLYQRPDDGRWIVRFRARDHPTGCSSAIGSEPPEAAKVALADFLINQSAEPPSGPRPPDQLSVAHVLALYADDVGATLASPETAAYSIMALTPFWGDLMCSGVTGATCRRYEKHRAGKAPSTIRRELAYLQSALNYAHKEGILIHPVAVTLPKASPPRSRWLTRGEAAKLLRASAPHFRRFVLIALYTGTRASTILNLRWTASLDAGWVDVENGVIHRQGARQAVSNKRRGSVKMPRRLAAHMRRWARQGGSHVVEYKGEPVASVKKAMMKACRRAKLEGVSPHVLKHTAVTWAFQAGMTKEDAADYFSTTSATLERVYRQHSPEYQNRAVSVMDSLGKQ